MKASDLFVKCLENEGVDYIFGIPGEELRDFMFSLRDSKIQFISARHEQGAGFMADVYGRISGKAGVCLATLGPGATNLITPVADAFLDRAPLVAITAQGGIERLHKESHQIVDVVSMFKPITKWNTSITSPNIIPEVVRKSFKLSESEKPGATHLELPEDIAALQAKGTPLSKEKIRRPALDHKALKKMVSLINSSKKPLILAGNGAVRKLASTQLRIFAEKNNIHVVSTFMGKGAISDSSPLSLMSIGLGSPKELKKVFEEADLIISVGYDVAEIDPKKWNSKGKKLIHIDFEHAEVYDDYQPSVEAIADISNILWALNEEIDVKFDFQTASDYRKFIEQKILNFSDDRFPLHPKQAVLHLRKALPDDAIVISDVGAHKMWIGSSFPAFERGSVIISNGLATMGIALPGAIGAKLASPGSEVISVVGDGGFLMNVQELETAVRLNLNFTIILFNDNSYSLIEAKFRKDVNDTFGTDLKNPDFKLLAESFGCVYFKVDSANAMQTVVKSALKVNGVKIIEVPVDKSANVDLFG